MSELSLGAICIAELLFERTPDASWLAGEIRKVRPRAEVDGSGLDLRVIHHDALGEFSTGKVPALTMFTATAEPPDKDRLKADLGQTWDWQGAADAVSHVRCTLWVMEMMASALERNLRLEIFLGILGAAIRATRPVALRWPNLN